MNSWQPAELEGVHDIYYGVALPPHRTPIPILRPSDRIGLPYLRCPPEKIIAVVPTDKPDYATPVRPLDSDSQLIAGHVLDFLTSEVKRGRLPGDFARNAYVAMFLTPSTVKDGAISCIVPMASHVDHTEHDVHVLVTEQGVADLRGLPPRRRAQQIIDHCAHPDYRPELQDYLDRATAKGPGKHTPHLLGEALSWHTRYLAAGTMRPA